MWKKTDPRPVTVPTDIIILYHPSDLNRIACSCANVTPDGIILAITASGDYVAVRSKDDWVEGWWWAPVPKEEREGTGMTKNQQILLDCAKNAATDAEMFIEGLQEGQSIVQLYDIRGTLRVNLEVALKKLKELEDNNGR